MFDPIGNGACIGYDLKDDCVFRSFGHLKFQVAFTFSSFDFYNALGVQRCSLINQYGNWLREYMQDAREGEIW